MSFVGTTQAGLLGGLKTQSYPSITQASSLVTHRRPQALSARTTQDAVLVTHRRPVAQTERITQSSLLVLHSLGTSVVAKVTQAALLIAWKSGIPGQVRQRAWTYDLDGHTFYVLDLSKEGTWVYDFSTQKWSKFETPGYGGWNFINGFAWESQRLVVGGDAINPRVNFLDTTSGLDDGWRPVNYIVTGGLPSRDRALKTVGSLRLACSAGYTRDSSPTMTMRFSDNNGATWSQNYGFNLLSGQYNQRVEWNSLGGFTIPGRVFEFSDQGGLVRIDGAEVEVSG